MDMAHMQKVGDVHSSVGEELDEASVWEYEVWREKEGGQEQSSSKVMEHPSSEEEQIQGEDQGAGIGAVLVGEKKHHQSFALQEPSPEKEDSSKSTHTTSLKAKTTEYIPIKQTRIESLSEYSGYSKTFANNNNANLALSPFDQNIPTNIMGTSAPINIPGGSAHNQFYKKRGQGEMDSPKHTSTLSTDFVPPHLIGTEDEEAELSTSIIKRDQLKRRNTILQQTGFLDSDK